METGSGLDKHQLTTRVRHLQAHPEVEETCNHVTYVRGPVAYCAEMPNCPALMTSPVLMRSIDFTPHREQGPLGDVVVLQGQGLYVPTVGDSLYTEVMNVDPLSKPLTLTPSFTWNNRTSGRMRI